MYGVRHQRQRDALRTYVATGQAICGLCQRVIPAGAPWDLDHTTNGPTHVACNRNEGAVRGNQARRPKSGWA
jgi:hypothetical protein